MNHDSEELKTFWSGDELVDFDTEAVATEADQIIAQINLVVAGYHPAAIGHALVKHLANHLLSFSSASNTEDEDCRKMMTRICLRELRWLLKKGGIRLDD